MNTSAEQCTARGVVRGKVQGVWFRAFTREQALARELSGYARNQPDGSVAFALTGPRDDIEAVLAEMGEGPPLAEVRAIEVDWIAAEVMDGFTTA